MAETPTTMEADMDAAGAHSPDDIDVRRILVAGAIVVATIIIAVIAAALVRNGLSGWFGASASPQVPRPPAVDGPALQPTPATDLEALRAEKRRMLNEYRWLDREKGIARIPIAQAMQRVVQDAARGAGK